LKGSWAEHFREKVMPLLLESEGDFAGLYSGKGRPCWSVGRLLGVLLLQHLDDLDDQRALDALSFDVRWQYALSLTSEEAYLSRRSLVEFRRRVVNKDPDGTLLRAVFDRIAAAGVRDMKVSTSKQRIDSTLVCSDIRNRGRVSLAGEVLRVFVHELNDAERTQLPSEVLVRTSKNSTWEEAKTGPSQEQAGAWLATAIAAFADNESVRTRESYRLMVRMLEEHAVLRPKSDDDNGDKNDDDSPQGPPAAASALSKNQAKAKRRSKKKRKSPKKARLWSAHDPDASFGHKGLGYHVHVAETCGNDGPEVLTDYEVLTAADTDIGRAQPSLERLEERGMRPEVYFADGGYPTPDGLLQARELGTELHSPVHRGKMPRDTMSRGDFALSEDHLVRRCPEGHSPTRHASRTSESATSSKQVNYAFFDARVCDACPKRALCPVRTPNNKRSRETRLELSAALLSRDQRWFEQHTEPWRAEYRIRAGVEATMHELKKGHGLGRLRVRRMARVVFQVALKVTSCNIKRWARAAARLGRPNGAPLRSWLILALRAVVIATMLSFEIAPSSNSSAA